jgi:hypothetical protein
MLTAGQGWRQGAMGGKRRRALMAPRETASLDAPWEAGCGEKWRSRRARARAGPVSATGRRPRSSSLMRGRGSSRSTTPGTPSSSVRRLGGGWQALPGPPVPTSSRLCRPGRGRVMVPAAAEGGSGVTGGGGVGSRNVAWSAWVQPKRSRFACSKPDCSGPPTYFARSTPITHQVTRVGIYRPILLVWLRVPGCPRAAAGGIRAAPDSTGLPRLLKPQAGCGRHDAR